VIPPEVPTGPAVGQAILGHQADGHALDLATVTALGQGQVRKIDGEAATTAQATVPREGDEQIHGAISARITKVMQEACPHGIAAGAVATARARLGREVAAALLTARLGEIFYAGDPFGDIGNILSWPVHGPPPDVTPVHISF